MFKHIVGFLISNIAPSQHLRRDLLAKSSDVQKMGCCLPSNSRFLSTITLTNNYVAVTSNFTDLFQLEKMIAEG